MQEILVRTGYGYVEDADGKKQKMVLPVGKHKIRDNVTFHEVADEAGLNAVDDSSKMDIPNVDFVLDISSFRKKLYRAFRSNLDDVSIGGVISQFLESANYEDLKDYGERLVAAGKISQGKFNQFKALLKAESKNQIDLDNLN